MRAARPFGLALSLGLAASPALALEVEGNYRAHPQADCAAGSDGDGVIRISDGVFYGLSGECRMKNPVNVRDMDAQLFDMECQGANPGIQWTERALFMKAAEGGLILAWNGYAFQYERCPLVAPETAVADPVAEPPTDTATEAASVPPPAE